MDWGEREGTGGVNVEAQRGVGEKGGEKDAEGVYVAEWDGESELESVAAKAGERVARIWLEAVCVGVAWVETEVVTVCVNDAVAELERQDVVV